MPFGHPCRHSLWSASEALGDACMPFRKGQPVLCIKFEQNRSKADYIQHLYDLFENPVGRPGRDTLLAHLHKYGIFVVVALGIDNLFGLKLIVTLISNSMIHFSIQCMKIKVYVEKK